MGLSTHGTAKPFTTLRGLLDRLITVLGDRGVDLSANGSVGLDVPLGATPELGEEIDMVEPVACVDRATLLEGFFYAGHAMLRFCDAHRPKPLGMRLIEDFGANIGVSKCFENTE